MEDTNQESGDSVIEAVKRERDREFAIEEWKSTQESIAQFNDLGLRMRVFGIGGVFLIVGYALKNDSLLSQNSLPHSSAVITFLSLILLSAVFILDRLYYTPLLIAAVIYGMELERALRDGREIINSKALDRIRTIAIPIGKAPKGSGPNGHTGETHIWGKTSYIAHHISIEVPSIITTLDRLYGTIAAVLLVTTILLSFI
jgi:hypothetical protein